MLLTLRDLGLYINFPKCEFWHESVAIMRHVVSKEDIRVDSVKIEVIRGCNRHPFVTEVCRVIG